MKKERLLCSGIGGFLFGLATVLGKAVYDHNTIRVCEDKSVNTDLL